MVRASHVVSTPSRFFTMVIAFSSTLLQHLTGAFAFALDLDGLKSCAVSELYPNWIQTQLQYKTMG
jgi:hypothetical protein